MSTGWSNENQAAYSQTAAGVSFDEGLRKHMLRLYNMVGGGIAVAGFAAIATAYTPLFGMLQASGLNWVVAFAPLIMLFVVSFRMHKMSLSGLHAFYWSFTAIMGVSLAYVFYVYTGESLARVFFITAATFAGASLVGYTTKKNLASMGGFLIMGVIGLIIASVVNIFMASSALQFAISVIGVLVFTGLTAYDTQNQKQLYVATGGGEMAQRMGIMGALSLFINFVNIFQFLLMLLGNRE
ncbi:MAG: Bax inhibitor-1/YccA family protein [Pseudomonadota bacterium]